MKESLKTLISNLGGLTAVAAAELVPKIKKKKETGEKTKDRVKVPSAGLKNLTDKDQPFLKKGGKTNG